MTAPHGVMSAEEAAALNAALLEAHACHDLAALVDLYARAADSQESAGDIDAACFFLTHAYIFGLELDHPDVPALHARLAAEGRV